MIKVLCVEDDSDDFLLIREYLRSLDRNRYFVERAASTELTNLHRGFQEYDLFIVDYQLNHDLDERGVQAFLRSVMESEGNPRVMLVTGSDLLSLDSQTAALISSGRVVFLNKRDLTPKTLNESLQKCLNRDVRVLVAEDDADDFETLSGLLCEVLPAECAIEQAASLEEAQQQLRAEDWHLLIVDYYLGPDRGLQLLQWLQDTGSKLPVVVVTGKDSLDLDSTSVGHLTNGALGFLTKAELSRDGLLQAMHQVGFSPRRR